MKATFAPPRPTRLARKALEVERLFGSGATEVDEPPDPESLLSSLLSDGVRSVPRRDHRYLVGLVDWTRAEHGRVEYGQLLDRLQREIHLLLPSVVGDLIPWTMDSPEFYGAIRKRTDSLKDTPRRLVLGALFAQGLPQDPSAYADTILKHTTEGRSVTLSDWRQQAGVPAGSALEGFCLRRLLSERMARWLASQRVQAIADFLREHREQEPTVLLANALLVPVHRAGARPAHLAPEANLTHTIGLFERTLPSKRSTARKQLAPEVEELLRWADLRARLERIFRQWKASDTYRPEYWRGWIRHIEDVREFSSMKAVAMRIRDHWFIEFGDSGNAAYAYSDRRWRAAHQSVRTAQKPWDLRNLDYEETLRHIHSPSPTPWNDGWFGKFDSWVRGLTHTNWERDL